MTTSTTAQAHTAGPWIVDKFGSVYSTVAKNEHGEAIRVCDVAMLPVGCDEGQRRANELLIAKTPELLRVCEGILELYADEGLSPGALAALQYLARNALPTAA